MGRGGGVRGVGGGVDGRRGKKKGKKEKNIVEELLMREYSRKLPAENDAEKV